MGHAVERRWPDATIACVASGPSLTQVDVDLLRGQVPVITVNDAVRLAPWADVAYATDHRWWQHHRGLPTFQGLKYSMGTSVGKRNPIAQHPDVTVLRNTGADGLELDPHGLRNGRNSGAAAVNLAVHFGAKRILLLGYTMGLVNGKHHFFGNHPSGLSQTSEALYVTFRRLFETLVEPLQAAGVTVLNCTPGTRLGCFPIADLREALASSEVAA